MTRKIEFNADPTDLFNEQEKKIWDQFVNGIGTSVGGMIDKQRSKIAASSAANDKVKFGLRKLLKTQKTAG